MKKILYVLGAGLVVGAIAAAFYFRNNKNKKAPEKVCEYQNFNDKVEEEKDKPSSDVIIAPDEPVYEDVKVSSIGSIYSRHEGAATIMHDTVDAISENIKVSESTSDELDDISAELDKMINED